MDETVTLPGNPRVRTAELEALHSEAFSWALSRCRHVRHDAQDLLQTAYARILDGSARFEARSTLRTFIFGVIDIIAREQRRRERIRSLLRGRFAAELEPEPMAAPHGEASSAQSARVESALRALSRRQRDVLELVFYRDCTIADAAQVMGVSLGSARTHYDRGKRALAIQLADLGQSRLLGLT